MVRYTIGGGTAGSAAANSVHLQEGRLSFKGDGVEKFSVLTVRSVAQSSVRSNGAIHCASFSCDGFFSDGWQTPEDTIPPLLLQVAGGRVP